MMNLNAYKNSVALCILTLLCTVHAGQCPYTAQLVAAKSEEEAKAVQTLGKQKSIPIQVTKALVHGDVYYKAQIQFIKDSSTASILSAALGYNQAWIFRSKSPDSVKTCISTASDTSLSALYTLPLFYQDKDSSYAILYQKIFGPEASARPSSMLVYAEGHDAPLRIEGVTGIEPTQTSILFGRNILLERSSAGQFKLGTAVQSKLAALGVPSKPGSFTLSYFADHSEMRINLLSELMLDKWAIVDYAKPGFDYSKNSDQRILWGGDLEGKQVGSVELTEMSDSNSHSKTLRDGLVLVLSDKEMETVRVIRINIKR